MRNIRLTLKIMISQPGKQIIAKHNFQYLKSKGDQTMKFGQLIEYNVRKIFLEKSYKKCGRETIPRPFSKKSKLNNSLDQ